MSAVRCPAYVLILHVENLGSQYYLIAHILVIMLRHIHFRSEEVGTIVYLLKDVYPLVSANRYEFLFGIVVGMKYRCWCGLSTHS